MECKKKENARLCPCTYPCPKKGMCCYCISEHRAKGEIPACFFSKEAEAGYDRSIKCFIKDHKNNNG